MTDTLLRRLIVLLTAAQSRRALPVFLLCVAACFVPAASAQVDGEWETTLGSATLRIDKSVNPPRISTYIRRREANPMLGWRNIRLDGRFSDYLGDGLVWRGLWHMPRDRSPEPDMRPCSTTSVPRGGNPRYDATVYWGNFTVTFNAAENRFDGYLYSCDGRRRTSPRITGTRLATSAAAVPPTTTAPATRAAQGCDETGADTTVLRDTYGRIAPLEFSPRYKLGPCTIDALRGDKFDILLVNPEGKRPVRLVMKGVRSLGRVRHNGANALGLEYAHGSFSVGLPFVGDPTPNTVIRDRTMRAEFCNAIYWLAFLDFSDRTQSPPIAMVVSECGRRLNPEPELRVEGQP